MWYPFAVLPFIGLAFAGLLREYLFWRSSEATPELRCKKVSVVVPMRGHVPEENIKAITSQNIDVDVEYLFVVDSPEDPAYEIAKKYGRVLLNRGEGKGAALATALSHVSGDCIVFADDDIRPGPRWLHDLVAPLSAHTASTTYRWYIGRGFCHKVRLAISNMGFPAMLDRRSRFVWGGSTAFRRELAERTDLAQRLAKYVSDDYAVYAAIKEVGGSIWFSKTAIAPTPDPNCKLGEAIKWGVRQILMVKWHAPSGWYAGLIIYTLGFLLSVAAPVAGFILSRPELAVGLALHPINLIKDVIRGMGVRRNAGISVSARDILATWAVGNFVIPLAVWISIFTRCTTWRGRRICRR